MLRAGRIRRNTSRLGPGEPEKGGIKVSRTRIVAAALCAFFTSAGAETAGADYASTVMSDSPSSYFRMDDPSPPTMNNVVPGELDGTHENVPIFEFTGALEGESPNFSVGYREAPNLDRSVFPIDFVHSTYDDFSLEYFVWTAAEPPPAKQWYDGYGLVDGEVTGVTTDAGTAMIENGRVGFGMGQPDVTISSQKAINDAYWHHVVATSDGAGLMRLYVDGVLEAETAGGPTAPRTNIDIAIGALQTNVGHFPGLIDEVAFYRHALTADDVREHYSASGRQAQIPKASIPVSLLGGGSGRVLGPFDQFCPPACTWEVPFGSTFTYFAFPDAGSRFGRFEGNCVSTSTDTCNVFTDFAFEWVDAYFFPDPRSLANGTLGATKGAAKTIDSSLDECVNPPKKKKKKPNCKSVLISIPNPVPGGAAMMIAVNRAPLLGSDGATYKSPDPVEMLSDGGGGLIGSDGATLIGSDGATLIGSDGATLISDKGVGLVGNAGNTRVQLAGISKKKPKPKYKTIVLGTLSATLSGAGGGLKAPLKLSGKGRKAISALAKVNAARRAGGKKSIPLPVTLINVVQPADKKGTGGSAISFKIK
jgi:hypothetical protein